MFMLLLNYAVLALKYFPIRSAHTIRWYLKLKCNSCGEVPDHWQYVSQEERVPVKVCPSPTSTIFNCLLRVVEVTPTLWSNVNYVEEKTPLISCLTQLPGWCQWSKKWVYNEHLFSYDMKNNNKAKTIVVFDCRGLEPVDFSPRMGWKVIMPKTCSADHDKDVFSWSWQTCAELGIWGENRTGRGGMMFKIPETRYGDKEKREERRDDEVVCWKCCTRWYTPP